MLSEAADAAPEAERSFAIRGQTFAARRPDPGLHLVSTPIGNLADVTLRALDVLAGADVLACEDTRTTRTLLDRYAIRRRTVSYHEHNAAEAGPRLLDALERGTSVALVSDAGTPLVSDPGFRLVGEAAARNIGVFPVPGASAVLAGLVAGGLPTDAFLFAGFLPQREAARRARLEELTRTPATLLFFEAPHRLEESLSAMANVLGAARPAAVCRELTKAFETVYRGTLKELAASFEARTERVRGEIVVVVGPPAAEAPPSAADADAILLGLLAEMKPADAAREAARLTGLNRRDLYRRALDLKG